MACVFLRPMPSLRKGANGRPYITVTDRVSNGERLLSLSKELTRRDPKFCAAVIIPSVVPSGFLKCFCQSGKICIPDSELSIGREMVLIYELTIDDRTIESVHDTRGPTRLNDARRLWLGGASPRQECQTNVHVQLSNACMIAAPAQRSLLRYPRFELAYPDSSTMARSIPHWQCSP